MGVAVGLFVIVLWVASGVFVLERGVHPLLIPLAVVVRTYLTTGLFITAHDAMHGSVSRRRWLNDAIGRTACFLFAAMSYDRLRTNHARHHAIPGSDDDPDFSNASFLAWFGRFMVRYTTVVQIVTMAVVFNLLRLRYDTASLWAFFAGPAVLASVQLFFFGTYLPHRGGHRARSLRWGHAAAMLSCYFFGYHREHHESPRTPWWSLWARVL
jgi:beta-carotene/zeaxanthin 4-ketolase